MKKLLQCLTCGAVLKVDAVGRHADETSHMQYDVVVPVSVTCAICGVDFDVTDVLLHVAEHGHNEWAVRMTDGSLRAIC